MFHIFWSHIASEMVFIFLFSFALIRVCMWHYSAFNLISLRSMCTTVVSFSVQLLLPQSRHWFYEKMINKTGCQVLRTNWFSISILPSDTNPIPLHKHVRFEFVCQHYGISIMKKKRTRTWARTHARTRTRSPPSIPYVNTCCCCIQKEIQTINYTMVWYGVPVVDIGDLQRISTRCVCVWI